MKIYSVIATVLSLCSCTAPAWVSQNCVTEGGASDNWAPISVSRSDSETMLAILRSKGQVIDGSTYKLWYRNEDEMIRLCRIPKANVRMFRDNPSCTTTLLSHFKRFENGSFVNIGGRDLTVVCVG